MAKIVLCFSPVIEKFKNFHLVVYGFLKVAQGDGLGFSKEPAAMAGS
jgi:hypothetical protein